MVSKLSKNESSVKRNQKGFETNLFAKRKKRENLRLQKSMLLCSSKVLIMSEVVWTGRG
jgi:hypothetical protein